MNQETCSQQTLVSSALILSFSSLQTVGNTFLGVHKPHSVSGTLLQHHEQTKTPSQQFYTCITSRQFSTWYHGLVPLEVLKYMQFASLASCKALTAWLELSKTMMPVGIKAWTCLMWAWEGQVTLLCAALKS